FHYLKLSASKTYTFSPADLQTFEEELLATATKILDYGLEIGKYPIGNICDLFNSKKKACKQEVQRRTGYHNVKAYIHNTF
ncbi:MAG: hypothetical protein KKF39_04725, partial [Nanoarchaeota archaeon]|nr:hypothetical protein [Nanoarchaeota archaeon]